MGGSNSSVSQNDINKIILSQLSSLGERLDSLEKIMSKVCPKQIMCQKLKNQPTKLNVLKNKPKNHRSDTNAIPASVPMHTIPPPEVQNRRQLAENAKPGTEKN